MHFLPSEREEESERESPVHALFDSSFVVSRHQSSSNMYGPASQSQPSVSRPWMGASGRGSHSIVLHVALIECQPTCEVVPVILMYS